MLYTISFWFVLFMLYSFIGYVSEIIAVSIIQKRVVFNRGFLIGPYLPIYGVGCMIMVLFLRRYENDLLALFIMSAFYCSVLEYFTSLIMEKIFKLRWWDYSNNKFNINGRICLKNAVLFGIGGIIVVKVLHPFFSWLVYLPPSSVTICVAIVLFVIFLADVVESCYITARLKINFTKYTHRDATEKIKKEVAIALRKHILLTSRLLKAFPNATSVANKGFQDFSKRFYHIKQELYLQKKKMKEAKKRK